MFMKTLEERRKKLCRLLREEGIQKAVIGEPMNIVYLTGIHIVPYERFYGLVADAEKEEFTMINPGVDTGCMKGTLREVTYQDENGLHYRMFKKIGID